MENNNEFVVETFNYDSYKTVITMWVQILYYCVIVRFILSIGISIPLLSRVVSIVVIVALFNLASVNEKYRTSALFQAVSTGGTILSSLLNMPMLTVVFLICSIVASYYEYNAHSEITEDKDCKLSEKWHSLFYLEIFSGFIVGFLSIIPIILGVFGQIDVSTVTSIETIISRIVNLVLYCLHGLYLKKTIDLYK